MVKIVNTIVFISTILMYEFEQGYQKDDGKLGIGNNELDPEIIYKTSMFANVYAYLIKDIYGEEETLITKEDFIKKLSSTGSWVLDSGHLRGKIIKMKMKDSEELKAELNNFSKYKPPAKRPMLKLGSIR